MRALWLELILSQAATREVTES